MSVSTRRSEDSVMFRLNKATARFQGRLTSITINRTALAFCSNDAERGICSLRVHTTSLLSFSTGFLSPSALAFTASSLILHSPTFLSPFLVPGTRQCLTAWCKTAIHTMAIFIGARIMIFRSSLNISSAVRDTVRVS